MTLPAYPTSPNTCSIIGLLASGAAFDASLIGSINALKGNLEGALANIQAIPSAIEQSAALDLASIEATIQGVINGAIASILGHVTSMIGNLVNNLGLAASHLTAQLGLVGAGCGFQSMGSTGQPGTDPCNGMQQFFGSLLGAGDQLVGQMTGVVNSLSNNVLALTSGAVGDIATVVTAINAGVASIEGIAANMTSLVNNEIAQFATATTDLLNFAMSSVLPSLFQNNCAQVVLNAVATPAMLSALQGSLP